MTLPDGRRLAWCERGDPEGTVVFAFHGLPGSRLQVHPDDGIARRAGVRIFHVDRPGFGLSDPFPARRLSDWPDDIRALADHLRIDRFAIAGISGGGPYACACVAELGDRITRAAIISSVGPPGSMSRSKSWVVRCGFAVAPAAPWAISLPIALVARAAARASDFYLERVIQQLPECDRVILSQPAIRAVLMRDIAEAFRQGHSAFLQDVRLEAGPWGISFDQVKCPVALWHGLRDTVVPPYATEVLAGLMPQATVHLLPDAGHFFVFDYWEDVVRWLAAG